MLLLGVCGAGKTALFQTLRSGSPYLTTVTSMEENDATFTVEGKTRSSGVVSKKLRVVDLPGHPRVANKLDVHVANARSAVFVLDAVDFASRRREVAERFLSKTHSFGPNSRMTIDANSALASTCSSSTTGAPCAR